MRSQDGSAPVLRLPLGARVPVNERCEAIIDAPLRKNHDYMRLWFAQVVSGFGTATSSVVYSLLVLSLTGSPAAAGVAAALGALPYLVLCIPAGALIDRWDRRRVMVVCDLARFIAISTIPLALWLNVLSLWQIYLIAIIEGTFFVFHSLAEVAALPGVVSTEQLPAATAQSHAALGAARVAGPSLGTFMYESVGRAAPFVIDALSFLLSALVLSRIRKTLSGNARAPVGNLGAQMVEGLRWLWTQPLIRTMALLTSGINLVSSATPLIMILLAKQLNVSDFELGVMFSIGGIGSIVGSLIGGRVQRRWTFGQVIAFTVWAQALLFSLFLLAPSAVLSREHIWTHKSARSNLQRSAVQLSAGPGSK